MYHNNTETGGGGGGGAQLQQKKHRKIVPVLVFHKLVPPPPTQVKHPPVKVIIVKGCKFVILKLKYHGTIFMCEAGLNQPHAHLYSNLTRKLLVQNLKFQFTTVL